ncbi:hypothetical protein [Pseudoxanthomonas indica]|uniref:Uncharacterized protein n=1 Tax=Pseudoxanthomonas indica TaxID=428993 RepID=A0A1T5LCA4_9GAMM|nr:hypothetical protein [Pseudoxanthomonas indica]SKC73676.1 hypothetical protein SAMN06296058_2300 [Pseudoxanthomonas indica]
MPRMIANGPAVRRWALRIALGLLVFYGVYLLAANIFINSRIGEQVVNRKPEKFQMHWDGGHSWWFGHVSLDGVRLQGQVRRLAWNVQAEHVSGHVAIWPLLKKEVRVPLIEADVVSGGAHHVTRELPVPPPRDGGWVLRFEHIVSQSLRAGNFDDMTLQGKGEADVGFVKQLRGGPMELLPSTASFEQARLLLGDREVLSEGVLQARFGIDRHRREEAPGIRKLLKTTAHLKLSGVTSAVDVVVDANGKIGYNVVPGRGQASIDLGFERGVLTRGSRVRWSIPVGGHDATGAARRDAFGLALAVEDDIALRVKSPPLKDSRLAIDADLRLRGREVPLADFRSLLPRASGHVVGQWRFSSLGWIEGFFPQATWLHLNGAGDVDADVQVVDGKLAPGSRIGVPEVDAVVDVMGNRIRGKANADIRLDAGPQGQLAPHLQATMEHFHIASTHAPDKPYVEGSNLRLVLDAVGQVGTLRDAMKGRVTFQQARVPDLRVYNAFLPHQQMRFSGGSGLLSGDLSLDTAGEVGQGTLNIAGRSAQMHLAGLDLQGDVDLNLLLRRADLKKHSFVADGSTVDFRNLSFREPGGEARSGWWAKLKLARARLDIDKPISAGGSADVTMKDVGFLLALFSRKKDYPKWVFKLVDAGQAQVDGRVQWQDDVLTLDRMQAHNQRFDLAARLHLQGKRRNGQLYAEWGVLSMGVEVRDGSRQFHLIRAKQWYQSQPNLLR